MDDASPKFRPVRLTSLAHGGGCGCKIAPAVLEDILSKTPAAAAFPNLLVGTETSDDAAVWKLNDGQAIVATTDFFMPVVDDPFDFGRIAATNALSDLYAMGAQPLFALVSPRLWIDANLKEDQLAHVRVGQPATVTVDAAKGFTFHARVASLSPGTGSSFALLPPENATGNWVKVVQRVTVRVELDEKELKDNPLQAGLSARVKIDTRAGSGSDGAAARP